MPGLLRRPRARCSGRSGPGRGRVCRADAPRLRRRGRFGDGGFFVMRNAVDHVFVDCGRIGLADRGGHGHNDCLSFEAVLDGVHLVTDCGSFVYTRSFEERNRFRSTASHNTPDRRRPGDQPLPARAAVGPRVRRAARAATVRDGRGDATSSWARTPVTAGSPSRSRRCGRSSSTTARTRCGSRTPSRAADATGSRCRSTSPRASRPRSSGRAWSR